MAIKAGLTNGTVDLLTSDTVIYTAQALERVKVEAFNCKSTTSGVVTFYRSPDDTSASGKEVGKYTFGIDEDIDINAMVGQGYAEGERIIAVASVVDINASLTFTLFTGTDV
jgi:type V secretory pathway adhesin AidA